MKRWLLLLPVLLALMSAGWATDYTTSCIVPAGQLQCNVVFGTALVQGDTLTVIATSGAALVNIEYKFSATPASVSITAAGCGLQGTCDSAASTFTSTSNGNAGFQNSQAYPVIKITVGTLSAGKSVTIGTSTLAVGGSSSGGGGPPSGPAGGKLSGTYPNPGVNLASGDIPNNAANTSGTAAGLSGTPALPNGTTASTQTSSDNSTKVATDAFVQTAVSGASSGALVLLEEHTASNSATLQFTSFYSSSYDDYVIKFVGLLPVSGSNNVYLRVSTNGGSSYDSGSNYQYAYSYVIPGTGTGNVTAASSSGTMGLTGTLEMLQLATAYTGITEDLEWYNDGSSTLVHFNGGMMYVSSSTINAFEIYAGSGNLNVGTVRVYGLTH